MTHRCRRRTKTGVQGRHGGKAGRAGTAAKAGTAVGQAGQGGHDREDDNMQRDLVSGRPVVPAIPWIRGLVFTVLVPGTVAVLLPLRMSERLTPKGGAWEAGWFLIAAGATGYALCLAQFLASGGTPAIFFTRPFKFLIGEEPGRLIQKGLYQLSRNPMYVSVLLVIFGQALRFGSRQIAQYGLFVWLCFHLVVVLLEEPHLREERGLSYHEYCRRVPRWIGYGTLPRTHGK